MANEKLSGYELSRNFFDWCFENPELVKPTHIAIYFFAIEHCNRLGWKQKFGFPTQMTMDAIGVKNWRTYIKAFNDLCEWGFFELLEKSKNQYSANVIAIVKNTKAHTKALSKASQSHIQKQSNSIVGINKLYNQEPINLIKEQIVSFCKNNSDDVFLSFESWRDYLIKQHDVTLKENEYTYQILLKTVKKYGAQKTIENIKYSITRNGKQILPEPEPNPPQNLIHLNQAAKHDSDKF